MYYPCINIYIYTYYNIYICICVYTQPLCSMNIYLYHQNTAEAELFVSETFAGIVPIRS